MKLYLPPHGRLRPLVRNTFFVLLAALSVLSAVCAGTDAPPANDGNGQTSLAVGIVTVILLIIAVTIVIIALLPIKKHPDPPKTTGKTPGMGNNGKGFKNTTPTETLRDESPDDSESKDGAV